MEVHFNLLVVRSGIDVDNMSGGLDGGSCIIDGEILWFLVEFFDVGVIAIPTLSFRALLADMTGLALSLPAVVFEYW